MREPKILSKDQIYTLVTLTDMITTAVRQVVPSNNSRIETIVFDNLMKAARERLAAKGE